LIWHRGVPWEQFTEAGLGDVGDAREYIGEPSLGVDVVEFSRADKRVHERGALTAAI